MGAYSNGYSVDVTPNCTFTCTNPVSYDDQTIVVTLDTFTLTIPIVVNGIPVLAPSSTQALYHLNNDLINAVDNTSGTSNDTSPTYVSGKFGNGLQVDTSVSSEYYKFPLKTINWNDMITGSHTFEYWVKYIGTSGSYTSTSIYTNTRIQRSSASNVDSLFYGGNGGDEMTLPIALRQSSTKIASFPTTIPKDTWCHIALTFFNGEFYCFLNGTLMSKGVPKAQTTTLYENFNCYFNSASYCYDEIMFCDEAKYLADFTPNHAPYYLASPVLAPNTTYSLYHFEGNLTDEVSEQTGAGIYVEASGKFNKGCSYVSNNRFRISANSSDYFVNNPLTIEYWCRVKQGVTSQFFLNCKLTSVLTEIPLFDYINLKDMTASLNLSTGTGGIGTSTYEILNRPSNLTDWNLYHHIAIVFDGEGHWKTFFDGLPMATGDCTTSSLIPDGSFYVCGSSMDYDELLVCNEKKYWNSFTPNNAPYYLNSNNS